MVYKQVSIFLKHFQYLNRPLLQSVLNPNAFNSCRFQFNRTMAEESTSTPTVDWKNATSVYDFHVKDIDGNDVSLDRYRGHPLIIVNVACKCGFADSNYKQLEEIFEKYREEKGLRVLGFPSNQFANQEPGSEEEIKEFIKQYNVQFDMFSKIKVNGDDADPLYKYLKHKQKGLLLDAIKWNFTKFVVNKDGQPVARYAPNDEPRKIEKDLEKLLQ